MIALINELKALVGNRVREVPVSTIEYVISLETEFPLYLMLEVGMLQWLSVSEIKSSY